MVKLMKCKTCGSIVEVILPGEADKCCGEEREELTPNTTDAAQEKHVPEVSVDGNKVTVMVGSVEHPMMPEHHIANIWLETTSGVQRANLDPEGKDHWHDTKTLCYMEQITLDDGELLNVDALMALARREDNA